MPEYSKIKILSTPGGEFISLVTKKEYVGLYRYERGLPFMGAESYGLKARLYDIRFGDVYNSSPEDILSGGIEARTFTQLKPRFGQHLDDPSPFKASPTEKEYSQSRMTRYFIKNLYTGKITEASKLTYKKYSLKDFTLKNLYTGKITEASKLTYKKYSLKDFTLKNLYSTIQLQWKLTGPLNDVVDSDGTIIKTGIIQTNEKSMALHKKEFPELPLILPADDLAKITS